MIVYWVHSLESPQWSDSNEYTQNIQFHDKIRRKSLNICFLQLLEGFCRDWKTKFESSTVKSSGFEPLRLYCIYIFIYLYIYIYIYMDEINFWFQMCVHLFLNVPLFSLEITKKIIIARDSGTSCVEPDGHSFSSLTWVNTGWFSTLQSSRKHAYIILTPLNPTFI